MSTPYDPKNDPKKDPKMVPKAIPIEELEELEEVDESPTASEKAVSSDTLEVQEITQSLELQEMNLPKVEKLEVEHKKASSEIQARTRAHSEPKTVSIEETPAAVTENLIAEEVTQPLEFQKMKMEEAEEVHVGNKDIHPEAQIRAQSQSTPKTVPKAVPLDEIESSPTKSNPTSTPKEEHQILSQFKLTQIPSVKDQVGSLEDKLKNEEKDPNKKPKP
jgi:hypothetical protein